MVRSVRVGVRVTIRVRVTVSEFEARREGIGVLRCDDRVRCYESVSVVVCECQSVSL